MGFSAQTFDIEVWIPSKINTEKFQVVRPADPSKQEEWELNINLKTVMNF